MTGPLPESIKARTKQMREAFKGMVGYIPKAMAECLDDIDLASGAWETERQENELAFDLYDNAMRRGNLLWKEAHPESGHIWPSADKLACWLMEELEHAEARLTETTAQIMRLPKPPDEIGDGPQERVEYILARTSDVLKERDRQDQKWGVQDHDDIGWLLILMEEIGEVADVLSERIRDLKAIPGDIWNIVAGMSLYGNKAKEIIRDERSFNHWPSILAQDLNEEILQGCAVALAWLECRKRRADGPNP